MDGIRPKDIAPKIYEISNKKNCSVHKALTNAYWISQVKAALVISLEHIAQFVTLWERFTHIHLDPTMRDSISWKFTSDGQYSASSAYRTQFIGLVGTEMNQYVWKNWAPPKCKFFAWLVINNRIWTIDGLHRRGWPNCNLCPLCQQVLEMAAHLLFQCRYTIRVWNMIKTWLALHDVRPNGWRVLHSVKE